jgi:NADH-quinone oxidoreductase subunit G
MATAMINLEIDGKAVQVPGGSTVMDAATKLGIFVPHFCYHRKLSIAANCRMCLVQVEKAPKPQPACATPAAEGMKVWTHSEQATTAQKGVMEFLLINHPLDCPICDQGGECQLQDLAVGYGGAGSRYAEAKRVVPSKDIGPLVSAEEMTRCIHCTRCVRFGQEIAGVMELGMHGRGEHSEILAFVGRTVDSELSGNMIDLCPVGALTSKPFRYSARTWELARRRSVAPHDALGSNLVAQVKHDRVLRVVPWENEAINECWLSDRDRFSYEGLYAEDRLTEPMVRADGGWRTVDWQTALETAVRGLAGVRDAHGGGEIGALLSPHSTLEELHLGQKLVRGLGSDNVDFRLRQRDFSGDAGLQGVPWLGMPIAEVGTLDRVLFVGGYARKDSPLLTQRFRQAAKRGQEFNLLHVTDDDLLLPVKNRAAVAPSALPRALAEIVVAAERAKGAAPAPELAGVEPSASASAIAASLAGGAKAGVFLGNLAAQHPQAAQLHALAARLASVLGARLGFPLEAANSAGGHLANARPKSGLTVRGMIESPRRAYLLLGVEPEIDCGDPRRAAAALAGAEFVVALTAFRSKSLDGAHVLLPVSPFAETSGTFVNCEGTAQSFHAVAKPLGEARPGWKVLRVLGTLLGLPGFEAATSEAVRDEVLGTGAIAGRLSNATSVRLEAPRGAAVGLERIADVPPYFADPLVRRAASLQRTADAQPPVLRARGETLQALGVAEGQAVRVRQGGGEALVAARRDESVPANCVRLATAHALAAGLGAASEPITVERA